MTLQSTSPVSRELEGRSIAIKVQLSPALTVLFLIVLINWTLTYFQDNIGIAGVPCTNGTAAMSGWLPLFDATLVTRILDAGGVITGKSGTILGHIHFF
jgi:hypothetical protein